MSSLAERLKEKGFQLIDERPPPPNHSKLTGAPHRALTISAKEQTQIFKPLEQRGQKAIQAEAEFQKECGRDLLKGVRKTVVNWVQECVSSAEKQQQLREKGLLKCRVQAQWSTELNADLHTFIESFGGRVAASCEKENAAAAARPAWEKYAARDEKWTVGFDAAAFESFIRSNPQVLGPSDCRLREFIEEYSCKVDLEVCTIRALFEALEKHFGPLRETLKARAKQITAEVVNSLAEERRQRGSKKRPANDISGCHWQPKRAKTAGATGLRSPEDAAWAAEMLAPLGLKPNSNELAARAPPIVLAPILTSLKTFEPTVELLRSTNLGVIVGGYRTHPSPEIARVAQDLVRSWKAACVAKQNTS